MALRPQEHLLTECLEVLSALLLLLETPGEEGPRGLGVQRASAAYASSAALQFMLSHWPNIVFESSSMREASSERR